MKTTAGLAPALQAVTQTVTTQQSWVELVGQLETSKALVFGTRHGHTKAVAQLPHVLAELIPSTIAESQDQLEQWLGQLLTHVRQLPQVTVTVAYLPTAEQATELLKLTRAGFTHPVIVDLQTDTQLLAGIRVEFQNRRIQVSLEHELTTAWNDRAVKGTDE